MRPFKVHKMMMMMVGGRVEIFNPDFLTLDAHRPLSSEVRIASYSETERVESGLDTWVEWIGRTHQSDGYMG